MASQPSIREAFRRVGWSLPEVEQTDFARAIVAAGSAASGATYDVTNATYGARGDGSTNDTVSVQAAITAAAVSGGVVFFPPGTYVISSSLDLGSAVGVTLRGVGRKSVISGTVSGAAIKATSGSFLNFQDLYVSATCSNSFLINTCTDVNFDHAIATGATAVGTFSSGGFTLAGVCTNVRFKGCRAFGNGASNGGFDIGCHADDTSLMDRIFVEDCACTSTLVDGNIGFFNTKNSFVGAGTYCSGARVSPGGTDSGGYGIFFYKTAGAALGTCDSNRISDVIIKNTEGAGIYLQTARKCQITNFLCDTVATVQTDASLTVGGIGVNMPAAADADCEISNGEVISSGKSGIDYFAGQVHISNVRIKDPASFGIYARAGNDCDITGGSITGATLGGIYNNDYVANTHNNYSKRFRITSVAITGSLGAHSGIALQDTRDLTVSGCVSNSNGAYGIQIVDSNGVKIIGNDLKDNSAQTVNTYSGVSLYNCSYSSFVGNDAYNTAATGQKYGLITEAGSDVVRVSGNIWVGSAFGNQTSAYSLTGSSNVLVDDLTLGAQTFTGAKDFSSAFTAVRGTFSGSSGYGVILATNVALALRADGSHYLVDDGTDAKIVGQPFRANSGFKTDSTDSSNTPGAATINKPSGRSSIASGASSVVITNSLVTVDSHIFVNMQASDATTIHLKQVPGSGSFTVTSLSAANATVNATSTVVFDWFIINP